MLVRILLAFVFVTFSFFLVAKTEGRVTAVNFADCNNVAIAFAKLISIFTDELQHDNFATIRTICLTRASKKFQKKICKTTDICSFFELLSCNPLHFNWMNIKYLETMAAASKSEKLQDVLQAYIDVIFSKTLTEIWDCIPSFHSTSTGCYSIVKAIFSKKVPDDFTVGELIKCKPKFARKIALQITNINKGSLTVIWCTLAEETYQAYLLALAVPQECREDDFLQIGVWVVHHPQFVIQELKKVHSESCNKLW